ncbi:MAG: ABC transporter permease [archaeon]|nr:ABC transporter permease [archaeon]
MSNSKLNFFDAELLHVAFSNLKSQKLRSGLSILGIIIGIASIVALISLGEGLNTSVQEQFEMLGTDTLVILPGGGFAESILAELQEDDPDTVESVRGVESAVGVYVSNVRLEFKDEIKSVIVFASDASKAKNLESMGMVDVEFGRALVEQDRGNILIGPRLADGFFENEIQLRENLKINDDKLRVVGILSRARHFFGAMFNNAVFTTLDDLEDITRETHTPFRVMVKISDGQDVDEVRERVYDALEKSHGKKDFQITSPQQAGEVAGSVIGIIQLVLAGIAAISLVVGGVVIMNTMVMAVAERTHEIGVLKAIGATNTSIRTIFLAEAALIGLFGGILGILVGIGLSTGASLALDLIMGLTFQAVVSPTVIAIALTFSIVVGVLSGLVPSTIASNLDPVEAMRK